MDNTLTTERIEMSYASAKFFEKYANTIGAENHIDDSVEWHTEPGGICLKGKYFLVSVGNERKKNIRLYIKNYSLTWSG